MQFSTITTVLAFTAAAFAAPAVEAEGLEVRTGTPAASNKQLCCNGILTCVVQILGDVCTTKKYNCKTSAPAGSTLLNVNLQLLNCVSL
ncbi:uncharacterized protein BCR38DRAFT_524923 [Pseudomassariella vexata]|uniref:Hydrophobin n=1 Tax=Pseudomassariella vexata TaxID=1141098 RepID=A0A1Y2DXJ2_9PEZI|nr:uncharacterized protein BCR38DRAFT_524923 [Pseudomassariella vexata]ORY63345.1 hypothetical protein BCR38DRAFT_524923 [Pseudomassariella vexata]